MKVRANCNLHGRSRWTALETTTTTTNMTNEPSTSIPIGAINMIIQMAPGVAIMVGMVLAIKRRFKQYHNLMTIATLVNGASILLVMIPPTPSFIAKAIDNLNIQTLLFTPHMIVGVFTEVLAIIIILKKPRRLKRWMSILFTSWIISFILGAMIYLIIY